MRNLELLDFYTTAKTTPATVWPVTAAELKTHMREGLSDTDNDAYITELIKVATEVVELYCRRTLINTTYTLKLPNFPRRTSSPIQLPWSPLSSVTSVAYVDSAGDDQTWSTDYYDVITSCVPEEIRPSWGYTYPVTLDQEEAVTIIFISGYGAAATSVPATLKHVVKLFASELYESRAPVEVGVIGRELPLSFKFMCNSYRVPLI